MSVKRILFLVGDYVEDYETMVPFQALAMVGHHVDAVSPAAFPGETASTWWPTIARAWNGTMVS